MTDDAVQLLSPVRFHDGEFQARDPRAGWSTIFDPIGAMRRWVHGWHAVGVYRGFEPVLALELRHDSGEEVTWFLDSAHRRIDHVHRLPPHLLAVVETIAVPALRHVREALLTGSPGPDAVDPLGLRVLNLGTLSWLIALAGERIAPPPIAIDLSTLAPDTREIVLGEWTVPVAALRACLAPSLQEQHRTVLAGGDYEAACPFTGAALRSRVTIVEQRLSACRFEPPPGSAEGAPIFYLCNKNHLTERELFIPVLNCVVAERAPEHAGKLFQRLLATMVKHADLLPDYLAASKRPANILTPYPGLHMGHTLWNELTGIDRIRRVLPAASLPTTIVPNANRGTEVYGPIDRIFPELAGKVCRMPEASVARHVYRERLTAMRVYDHHITDELATRICRVAREDPACHVDHARAAEVQRDGRTLLLIGLRSQNRMVPDQVELWRNVIEHLSYRLGALAVVLDGVNARIDADPATDYGMMSPQSGRPPVLDELEVVVRLRAHFRGETVRIMSTVGAPVARSLFWAQQAMFFVAFWGAGLAKYRWVANKPGLVLTNRCNLVQLQDELRIYHAPENRQAPTPLDFIAPEHVNDIGPEFGFYSNFTVELPPLLAALDRLIDRRDAATGRTVAAVEQPLPSVG